MRIVVLDSIAVPGVLKGPGSPAYFSRFAIEHLRQAGHAITIEAAFDEKTCAEADVVWTEWCNEEAYWAADSGVCKKLVLRMRGFDVWGPLEKLKWENVDTLVYESPFLQQLAEERYPTLKGFRTAVLPSGVDVDNIPFKERKHGPVVALVARGVPEKGYQLAFEWARQRADIQLHVVTALRSHATFQRYLEYSKPSNVVIHETVDTVRWLDEIDANYLLSASTWESLGYTIAEAMAMGIQPLIHNTPGAEQNWGDEFLWDSFEDLDVLTRGPKYYRSQQHRGFVFEHLNATFQSSKFADLLAAPSARPAPSMEQIRERKYEYRNLVLATARAAVEKPMAMAPVTELVEGFRQKFPPHSMASDERYGTALAVAAAFFNREDLTNAEVWVCRALVDFARPDSFCLLGEIADARGDIEEAVRWYKLACVAEDVPQRYRLGGLIDKRHERLEELQTQALPKLAPADPPNKYLVVVTVRNGEQWIERCLNSIRTQTVERWDCIVVDDCSIDETWAIVARIVGEDSRFTLRRNTERKWQARNTVETARYADSPEDVVVLVDGDDWLADDRAFEHINAAYRQGAWMTYGNVVEHDGRPSGWAPYPQRIARAGAFHEWNWCATAPRSFKRFLLDALKDEDFTVDGTWPKMAGDVAVVLPLLQMACERALPIQAPIYVYNTDTPHNDHKTDAYEQMRVRDRLYDRPPRARLERP